MNKVMLIGNLGAYPKLRFTPDGIPVANFSIATNTRWTDKESGDKKSKTEWHRIVAWRNLGELCAEYLSKGDKVYVGGKMQTRSWVKDGITRYITEVNISEVEFLPKGSKNKSSDIPPDMDVPPEELDDYKPF
jgi:single-strand DNA-binding protein